MVLTKYIDPDNGYAVKVKTMEQANIVVKAINEFTGKDDDCLNGIEYSLRNYRDSYIKSINTAHDDISWILVCGETPNKTVDFKTAVKVLSKEQL